MRILAAIRTLAIALTVVGCMLSSGAAGASDEKRIILQSTTSTANSGLYEAILPQFTARTGIEVSVVAVGTGQAIRNAVNGDGDVLLVHARRAEEAFVAEGHGVRRFDVMYNDFVLVGPGADPAGVDRLPDAVTALTRIALASARFASRGDNSGTHKRELALWQAAGIDVESHSGRWYLETGSGMGATLNIAIGLQAYTLTDRGTWISFGNKQAHRILVEGDAALLNQYGVILVNPARHPRVRAEAGQAFIDWLIGPEGQDAIGAYRVNDQQLFIPNAR